MASEQHYRLTGMIIDRANAVALVRLSRGRNHDLLALWAPHRSQGRHPREVELIRIIEDLLRFQGRTGVFNRLFLTAYSGSGLLIVCCGRLMTMSAAFRWHRTVSASTRIPVCSAR